MLPDFVKIYSLDRVNGEYFFEEIFNCIRAVLLHLLFGVVDCFFVAEVFGHFGELFKLFFKGPVGVKLYIRL